MSKMVKAVWLLWERFFHFAFRLEAIHPGGDYLFFIAKRTYIGRRFSVGNEVVKPFDKVIELHLNNKMLVEAISQEPQLVGLAVRLVKEAKRSMPILAQAVRNPRFDNVRVIYGVTFINRGITRLGFQVLPMQNNLAKKLTTWHLKNVLRVMNPDANRIMNSHENVMEPMLVAVSKDELIARFCSQLEQKGNSVPVSDHCLT